MSDEMISEFPERKWEITFNINLANKRINY